ncbi:PKD family protein [Chitinophaga skermanii]|uniref:PKD family protein n=2 Tax=Chitinophaga skermanii TaxID=331697 RepID=A0A327QYJ5_9BACT|nr:PKD family protein [Chitinophaga skermanii]
MIAVVASAMLTACYKDKGNYDYTDPEKLTVVLPVDRFSAKVGDTLKIDPEILMDGKPLVDTANYTFEYYAFTGSLTAITGKRKDLGGGRDLRFPIGLLTGDYALYLKITDKRTNYAVYNKWNLKITSDFSVGWMLLSDINGQARLDMVAGNDSSARLYYDVLDKLQSGVTLQGSPKFVSCYCLQNNSTKIYYGIHVGTSQTTQRIDCETMQWNALNNIRYEVSGDIKDNFAPDWVRSKIQTVSYMKEDTNIYYYNYSRSVRYGVPINKISTEPYTFKASKYISISGSSSEPSILYDETNHRFVRHIVGAVNCVSMPTDAADSTFSYQDRNYNLRYMVRSHFGGGEAFAIMENKTTKKLHLLRISTTGANIRKTYWEEMKGIDIEKGENFCIDDNYGFVFYNVGSKVYKYDISTYASYVAKDYGNKKISFMAFQETFVRGSLGIATYDPSLPAESCGTWERFTVPQFSDPLKLIVSNNGFGKIISVAYKPQ